jgi:hypothetical protein
VRKNGGADLGQVFQVQVLAGFEQPIEDVAQSLIQFVALLGQGTTQARLRQVLLLCQPVLFLMDAFDADFQPRQETVEQGPE